MPRFRYSARMPNGDFQKGDMQAQTASAVADQLQSGGMIPLKIEEVTERVQLREKFRQLSDLANRVSLDDLILFSRQMYSLIHAGVPIIRSLEGMLETVKNRQMKRTLQEMIQGLEQGGQVSEVLADFPRIFPPLFTSIIHAGESGGRLDEAFLEVSKYLEREKETKMRVKSALRYPSFVVIAIAVAIAIVTLFVIPTFAKVFASFEAELPLPTRILMSISDFATTYWPYIFGFGILLFFSFRSYINTEKGRFQCDRFKLKIPIVGNILLRTSLARFARSFATGFSSGVPLLQTLNLTSHSVGNSYIGYYINEMSDLVERGENLTNSASSTGLFTPLVLQMLSVGEETGGIDSMLSEVADFYDREVDYDIRNLSSNIEPILITFIGAMVLLLALGVFLPMWNLGTAAL